MRIPESTDKDALFASLLGAPKTQEAPMKIPPYAMHEYIARAQAKNGINLDKICNVLEQLRTLHAYAVPSDKLGKFPEQQSMRFLFCTRNELLHPRGDTAKSGSLSGKNSLAAMFDGPEVKESKDEVTFVTPRGPSHSPFLANTRRKDRLTSLTYRIVARCFERAWNRNASNTSKSPKHINWPFLSHAEFFAECHRLCGLIAIHMLEDEPRTFVADATREPYKTLFDCDVTLPHGVRRWFVLQALPLRRVGEQAWVFPHVLLWEYFYAHSVVSTLINSTARDTAGTSIDISRIVDRLGAAQFTQVRSLLEMHAEQLADHMEAVERLLYVIDASRNKHSDVKFDQKLVTAASNAISILNYGARSGFFECNFYFRDLRGIRIPYANLNDAVITYCDFEGADLSYASMNHCTLVGSNFTRANLTGVRLRLRLAYQNTAGNELTGVCMSPDGASVVTVAPGAAILTKHLRDRREVVPLIVKHRYRDEPLSVYCACFSPDGSNIAAGLNSGHIAIFETATGKLLRFGKVIGDLFSIERIAYMNDGNHLIIRPHLGAIPVLVIDAERLLVKTELKDHSEWLVDVQLSRDNTLVAAITEQSGHIWHVAGKELVTRFKRLQTQGFFRSICFSLDARTIFVGLSDGRIAMWSMDSLDFAGTLFGHTDGITRMALSPNGWQLASASVDGSLRIWDLTAYVCVAVFRGHRKSVVDVCWSPSGRTLLSVGDDGVQCVWELPTDRECRATQVCVRGNLSSASVSKNNSLVVLSSYNDYVIRVIDTYHNTIHKSCRGHTGMVSAVSFGPDGKTFASGSYDRTVRIWDVNSPPVHAMKGHRTDIQAVCFSPNGRHVVSGGEEVRIWDIQTWKSIVEIPKESSNIHRLSVSPDGRFVDISSMFGSTRLYEVESKRIIHTIKHRSFDLRSTEMSPDGLRVAQGGTKKIRVIEVTTGKIMTTFKTHDEIESLCWDADGKILFGGSKAGWIGIWNAKSGDLLGELHYHAQSVIALQVSNSGKVLTAVCRDGSVSTWHLIRHEHKGKARIEGKLFRIFGRTRGLCLTNAIFADALMDDSLRTALYCLPGWDGVKKNESKCTIA